MSDSFAIPWTVAHQASMSMGFPRQEYWNGLSFPTPEDLPNPGIKPMSPAWQVDSLPLSHLGSSLWILPHPKNVYLNGEEHGKNFHNCETLSNDWV